MGGLAHLCPAAIDFLNTVIKTAAPPVAIFDGWAFVTPALRAFPYFKFRLLRFVDQNHSPLVILIMTKTTPSPLTSFQSQASFHRGKSGADGTFSIGAIIPP